MSEPAMHGTAILVESLEDWDFAISAGLAEPHSVFTTSPMVIETLRTRGVTVSWADRLVPADWPEAIGLASGRAVRNMKGDFQDIAQAARLPELWSSLAMPLHNILSTLLFKRAVLERFLQVTADNHVIVGEKQLSPVGPGSFGIGFFDTAFAAVRGENEGRILATPVRDVSGLYGDIDRPTLTDRVLSLADLSLGQLLFRLHLFLYAGRRIRLRRGGPEVIVLRDNEAIREMYPWLLKRGCAIRILGNLGKVERGKPTPPALKSERLVSLLQHSLANGPVDIDASPVAMIVADRLAEFSRYANGLARRGRGLAEQETP